MFAHCQDKGHSDVAIVKRCILNLKELQEMTKK